MTIRVMIGSTESGEQRRHWTINSRRKKAMPPQVSLAHENFFHSEGGHGGMRARASRSRSRPAGARLERGGAALPDHRDAGALPVRRDANVVGEAGDDRQAHVLGKPQRNRGAG